MTLWTRRCSAGLLALAMLAQTACDTDAAPAFSGDAEQDMRLIHDNGVLMNGMHMNGVLMNGVLMNGTLLGGGLEMNTELVEKSAAGHDIAALSVEPATGDLVVATTSGVTLEGAAALPIKLTFKTGNGERYRFNVDAQLDLGPSAYAGGTLFHYEVSYQLEQDGAWGAKQTDLCVDQGGEPTEALLMQGAWDLATGDFIDGSDDHVTVACRGAAIAKCAEWSYRRGPGQANWAHQACTRLVRADYAGDGQAYTLNGTPIYVGDDLGLVEQSSHPGWLVKEAEWDEDGAVCINRDALRQADQTSCGQDPNCFPGIPECDNPDDLTPSSPGVIVTGVALTEFGTRDYLYGVKYDPQAQASILWMAAQDGAAYEELGHVRMDHDEDAQTPDVYVEIDGIFQTSAGLMGFQLDRAGDRSRLVSVYGDGTAAAVGEWLEGHLIHGADVARAHDGRVAYAVDADTDELCRVWTHDGALAEALGGCSPLLQGEASVDIDAQVDLVQDSESDELILVEGANKWQLDANGDNLVPAGALAGGALYGLARAASGALIGARDDALVSVSGQSVTPLAQLSCGAGGDLAGSPLTH